MYQRAEDNCAADIKKPGRKRPGFFVPVRGGGMKFLLVVLVIHLILAFISNRKEDKKWREEPLPDRDVIHPAEYGLR